MQLSNFVRRYMLFDQTNQTYMSEVVKLNVKRESLKCKGIMQDPCHPHNMELSYSNFVINNN